MQSIQTKQNFNTAIKLKVNMKKNTAFHYVKARYQTHAGRVGWNVSIKIK